MRTKITINQPNITPRSGARGGLRVGIVDRRIGLVLLLALLAGALAYQAPPTVNLAVGWLGDQLFLDGSEAQGVAEVAAGRWFGDELTDGTPTQRSRWTRARAEVALPGLGAGGDLALTLHAQGWPADVLGGTRQPLVSVYANDLPIGTFTPTSDWRDEAFTIRAVPQAGDDLRLTLVVTPTFTGTQQYPQDWRQKGVRVAAISVRAAEPHAYTLPAALPLALLALCSALVWLVLLQLARRPTYPFVLTIIAVSALTIGLALARVWTVALLPWLAGALALALLLVNWRWAVRWRDRLLRGFTQGAALNYGLIAAVGAWLVYVVARLVVAVRPPSIAALRASFPDSLLLGLLGAGLLVLLLVYGRAGLPRACKLVVGFIGSRSGAALLLALFLVVWLGYEAAVVAPMRYVGHADYADNAVVARNVLRRRGWVVDYVTQFYHLSNGVTRPQETWPLMQPVWIALAFALFGVSNWAAKVPNLLFTLALGLMVYRVGARIWDRRVGLTAAALVLTSSFFFFLVIYTTSDLAFVVFAFGALWLLYCATQGTGDRRQETGDRRQETGDRRQETGNGNSKLKTQNSKLFLTHSPLHLFTRSPLRALLSSAVLTGLMLLQKPASGALIACGMGLWQLYGRRAAGGAPFTRQIKARLVPIALWSAIALALLTPYLVRNIATFGAPFYSTESYDAWVLGYGKWSDIYKVYTNEYGGSETGGLPEKSWILRWGFDRTLFKVRTQLGAVRDYLLPPWTDQARPLDSAESEQKALLFGVGAWLALLGVLGALRGQRRLMTLLGAAFCPYVLFLTTYWHADEERYFVVWVPWLALLAAYALWRGYDRIALIGDGRWTPLGAALVVAAVAAIVQPSWPEIAAKVRQEPVLIASDLEVYEWLRTNTQPDDVIMTRVPWQLNWASERPALMIPTTVNRATLLRLARYYNARYLVLDVFQRPNAETRAVIDALRSDGTLREVHRSQVYDPAIKETFVYSFPADYGGVAAITP